MKSLITDVFTFLNSTLILVVLFGLILLSIGSNAEKQNTTGYEEVDVKLEQPEFLLSEMPTKEYLLDALEYYEVKHPDIVYAQAILETGNLRSKVCKEYNNLFGLWDSRNHCYYSFNHWSESVVAYIDYIQDRYEPPSDYYKFLSDIGYAEDPDYINKLKRIVNQYDKRGTTDTICIIN